MTGFWIISSIGQEVAWLPFSCPRRLWCNLSSVYRGNLIVCGQHHERLIGNHPTWAGYDSAGQTVNNMESHAKQVNHFELWNLRVQKEFKRKEKSQQIILLVNLCIEMTYNRNNNCMVVCYSYIFHMLVRLQLIKVIAGKRNMYVQYAISMHKLTRRIICCDFSFWTLKLIRCEL